MLTWRTRKESHADLILSDKFQQRRGRTRQPSQRLHSPSHQLRQKLHSLQKEIGGMQSSNMHASSHLVS